MKIVGALCVFFFITAIVHSSFSQKKDLQQYIVKDSMYIQGEVFPLKTGTEIVFQRTKRDERVMLSAKDITEYGYEGKIFETLETNKGKVFFQKIVSGNVPLYQGYLQYAIKVDSSFYFFNEEDYRSMLSKVLDFEGVDQSLSKLDYSKKALSNFVRLCNQGECAIDNFPYKKLGVYGGYNFFQFTSSFNNIIQLSGNGASPSLGIFYDFPMYRPNSLFLSTELNWSASKPFLFFESNTATYSLGLRVNSFNSLISAKWVFSRNKIKPYLKAGSLISYVHVSSEDGMIRTRMEGNDIIVFQDDIASSGAILLGFNSSIGVEVPYKNRKKFHVELKYLNLFDGELESFDISISGFSFVVGFNF